MVAFISVDDHNDQVKTWNSKHLVVCLYSCVNGTFGTSCEQSPEKCTNSDPCINGGTCKVVNGSIECSCPKGTFSQYHNIVLSQCIFYYFI
jgi:hypothetical protein